MEVSGQHQAPAALSQGNNTGTQWTEGFVGPSVGLDLFGEEKYTLRLPVCEPQNRPARRYTDRAVVAPPQIQTEVLELLATDIWGRWH